MLSATREATVGPMITVMVNAFNPGTRRYDIVCDTRVASNAEDVERLFGEPGRFGMNYEYSLVNKENGERLGAFYSDRMDMVAALRRG